MSETYFLMFKRNAETFDAFANRLRDTAMTTVADFRVTDVLLFVDDGLVGAPPEATAYPSQYSGALLVTGIDATDLPDADLTYRVTRRVIKSRTRGVDGQRTEGFTILCPSVRLSSVSHEQFDDHWGKNHSRVHVASSPGTCHYEQLVVDEALTPDAPDWDGIGLLSFASAPDYTERLFGPGGMEAIYSDCKNFVDLERGETIPTSEFIYRDSAA